VILVDANIILYAEDRISKHHDAARTWWDARLSGTEDVCLTWPVLTAFLRISTNARILSRPLSRSQASARLDRWLAQPCVRIVQETRDHWRILARLLEEADATANLIPDAHLAAIAVGHGCTLASSDHDFARFTSLSWMNPLESR
jgi:toxin-antitoxin system PIN domain toxin